MLKVQASVSDMEWQSVSSTIILKMKDGIHDLQME